MLGPKARFQASKSQGAVSCHGAIVAVTHDNLRAGTMPERARPTRAHALEKLQI
ncbi:hypothetical protein [Ottowia testudinis]|uniref:Uncharacterized protein n=1 Tax=Ottowia testudinis TaxID=2816950 RepID=A0A975CI28_9BURK|nr:hypothetical protein [Ottowia testudinis]QTD45337.1 hypothetical protein J1M35_20380 [Ottowia testudinis]